jgi:hypothetical protein
MIVVSEDEINDKWWICYSVEKTVVHYGKTEAPQQTESGLQLNQVFDNEASWLNVLLTEFNIVPE